MNIYKEVKLEIDKVYKPSQLYSKYNKLVGLKYKTEDTQLHAYIDSITPMIEVAYRLYDKKLMTSAGNKLHEIVRVEAKLREYCEMMLSQYKPEWMILAERNGWVPGKCD